MRYSSMGSHRLRHVALLVVPLALAFASTPVLGAEPDPTDESVAVDAMLVAEDLPWDVEPGELTIETDASVIDLPGWTENGGLRQVRQTWSAEDPFGVVFDFRFQLPDEAAAEAFLDASEDVLGEVASGAEKLEPPVSPVEDTRYYRYEDTVFGTGVVGHNFLMRDGNLVAKVYVSAEDLEADVAAGVAEAAAARMRAAVGGDVPGSPAPSASAGAALGELLSHVPSALRASCEPEEFSFAIVTVLCPQSDELSVEYTLFGAAESLDEWFDLTGLLLRANGADVSGDDCETGSYDGVWTLGGEEAGRLLCFNADGREAIVWSHPATLTYSRIDHTGGDKAAAWDLWLAAGPE
jgi:hypothetical protein